MRTFTKLNLMTDALKLLLVYLFCLGCASKPYDYTNFKKYPPKSILVLPHLNKSTDLRATYGCLSNVTRPIAELGYYVFPVVVVDELFKQNGMPNPGEMRQASLKKIQEIINPDAVMYIDIENYGSKYQVINSSSVAQLSAKLVDTKTGILLWSGQSTASQTSDSNLISAVVSQVIDSSRDAAHDLCQSAQYSLFYSQEAGLLHGPYYKKH